MTEPKHRILLIEDNLLNMELATDLLESGGLVVWQARTAEDGLCQARALPDIILMDLGLPGMDGLAAVRMLRATPAISHLPVIALTAHAMKGDRTNALGAGFDGYLTKPIDTRTFVKAVLTFIAANAVRERALQSSADSILGAASGAQPSSQPVKSNEH